MPEITQEQLERIGLVSDRIDNIIQAMQLPVSPSMHLQQVGAALPEIRDEIRAVFTEVDGENPWDEAADDDE